MTTIAVVGIMAAGKSSVGRALARHLRVDFHDVDHVIEDETGRSIPEIFADEGEPVFRALERATTVRLLAQPGVVSLGGGGVLDPEIRSALKAVDAVVWLQVSVTQATRRVGMNVMRPLLLGDVRANLERLLAEREHLYREVATMEVDSQSGRPHELVTEILARLPWDRQDNDG